MIWFYLSLSVALLLFLLITCRYKASEVKKLDKKKHKLKILYPSSMWLVDKLPRRLVGGNTKINRELKELSLKEDISQERKIYMAGKISIVIMVLFAGLMIGLGVSVSSPKSLQEIHKIKRKSSSTTYDFVAKSGKEEKNISLDVAGKKRTRKETYKALDNAKKLLVKKILAKNKSVNQVNSHINLVDSIGKEDIKISWGIEDSDIIGYDGEIGKSVPKKGVLVKLTAIMELDKVTEEYQFTIKVFPEKKSSNLQSYIQKHVDEKDSTKKEVELPTKIGGKVYKFFVRNSNYASWIFPLALVIAILLFVLKDRDLEKEIEERQKQMLRDYPNIVSKLLIYFGAGLSIKSAIERIVREYKKEKKDVHFAYEEMDILVTKMNSGVSETTAIAEFGDRCGIHCYIKLANIIEQNLRRGSKDMVYALKTEVNSAVNTRKNNILKEGSEISTKLLGPMIIMLIISIVIIMVPAFLSINI